MAVLDANEIMFTAFEPKVQNRFIMYIDGIPAYLIKKASAPGFDAGEVVLDHINVYRKVKGKSKWGDITMTLFDPITPSGAQAVMEWVRLHHESVTGRDGYSDVAVLQMWKESLEKCDAEVWEKTISHTEKIISEWWLREKLLDVTVVPLVISVNDSDSGDEETDSLE